MFNISDQFLTVILAHALAVMSPGPDFSVVLRESLQQGKKPAIWTAIGIGSGILVHVLYSTFGISVLIKNSPTLFQFLRWLGAVYILYLAWGSFTSSRNSSLETQAGESHKKPWHAWRLGFLTNALNPKASLFFLALFSVILTADTSGFSLVLYSAWMAIATMLWFTLVALFFSREKTRTAYFKRAWIIDRFMAFVLILLAIRLIMP